MRRLLLLCLIYATPALAAVQDEGGNGAYAFEGPNETEPVSPKRRYDDTLQAALAKLNATMAASRESRPTPMPTPSFDADAWERDTQEVMRKPEPPAIAIGVRPNPPSRQDITGLYTNDLSALPKMQMEDMPQKPAPWWQLPVAGLVVLILAFTAAWARRRR